MSDDGARTLREVQKTAKATFKPMQKVASRFLMERFADRIFSSRHAGRFVLKGGMLMMFAEDAAPLDARSTSDVDIQAPGFEGSVEDFGACMAEILAQDAGDGVAFDAADMKVTAVREGLVPGGSLSVLARIGTLKQRVKCDVTFDTRSRDDDLLLQDVPSVLPGRAPVPVRRIPFEHVVADKLQALVRHGPVNYRMRDYYDLYVILTRGKAADVDLAARNILATFDLFGSALPGAAAEIPALQDVHATRREPMWQAERKARDFWVETPGFAEMVREIRERAEPLFAAALDLRGPVPPQ